MLEYLASLFDLSFSSQFSIFSIFTGGDDDGLASLLSDSPASSSAVSSTVKRAVLLPVGIFKSLFHYLSKLLQLPLIANK